MVLGEGQHSMKLKCDLSPTRSGMAYAGSVMGREIVCESRCRRTSIGSTRPCTSTGGDPLAVLRRLTFPPELKESASRCFEKSETDPFSPGLH